MWSNAVVAAGLFLFVVAASADEPAPLRLLSSFPGGSAKVEGLDAKTRIIRVSPAGNTDRGWACWWYFKLEGLVPGELLTLDIGGGVWATPDRAAASADNKTWVHTGIGKREKGRIVYTHKIENKEMWFAWGPPFVPEHAQELADWAAKASPHATAFELCKSREGRSVAAVRISQAGVPEAERLGLWFNARQHAWESGSSWVARGLVEWLVSDDPRAQALRKKATIVVVPIMDADNVATGNGGKNQKPRDHNRDWCDTPHWAETAAAIKAIREWDAAGRFDVFVDLHNPGAGDRSPYFYVSPRDLLSPLGRINLDLFLAAAKEEITGPLRFEGKTLESGAGYDVNWERISKNWVVKNTRKHVLAVCLETSWNTDRSTADNYRRVGRELGLSVERYCRNPTRTGR